MKLAAVLLFSLALLFPTYWMITGSVQPLTGVMRLPPEPWPRTASLENYRELARRNPLLRWYANTGLVTVLATVGAVLTAAMAGYGFSAYRFPGRTVLWWLIIAALALPRMAIVIPQFVLLRHLGLARGLIGVLVPLWAFPAGVLLFRAHADTIPGSLHDAARIDGAGEWQIFTRIVAPLCRPVLGIMVIAKCFEAIGDYLWQSLMLTQSPAMTIVVGLVAATQRRSEISVNPIGITLAAGVLMMIPMLAVFLVFQRSFRHGLLGGATKE